MKQILDKVAVVMLDITTWTGRKVLSKADRERLGVSAPDEIVSIGHKRIIDPKAIAVFGTLKKRAERACGKRGVRFLGGYAVPISEVPKLLTELAEIKREYEQEREHLNDRIGSLTAKWADEHAEWRDILGGSAGAHNLRFSYHSVMVAPVEGDNMTAEAAGQLGNRLFQEVARDIRAFWDKSLKGRETVTQKALRPLRAVMEKIEGMAFVDPRAVPLADYIKSVLDSMPKAGPLDQSETAKVAGLALALSVGDGSIPKPQAEVQEESPADQEAEQPIEVLPQAEADADESPAEEEPIAVNGGWF